MTIKQKSKKIKTKKFFLMWVIVALLAVTIVASTILFYRYLNVRLFAERQSHLQEIAVKISEVLDTTINSVQSKAYSAQRLVEKTENIEDEEHIIELLKNLSYTTDLDNALLLVMDTRGKYYSSEGRIGRWQNNEDLIDEEAKPVIRDINLEGTKSTYMVFFGKLDKPITIGDGSASITHTAVAMPLDNMKETFTISGFEGNCYTYLVNDNGRMLYKQTFSNEFIEEYNVLSALEKEKFHMGNTVEELAHAVNQRERLCVEFESSGMGEDYFVSTVPISDSDWTVLLFVPKRVLGAYTSSFMTYVITYFIAVAAAFVIIFGCLIFTIVTSKNDRKLLAQQEENNKLLVKAADEAQSANAAKSEFLSHMSHDIRTPINGIVGMTNIAIKNSNDPIRVADCLKKIDGSADHLLTLINDVLDMSRIESGKIVIAHEPMDIRTLIENCSSIIDGQILSRQIEFKKEFGEFEHPYLFGDELHIRQVLINILGNSVKFTHDGGKISFRVNELSNENDKAKFRFEIEDTGIGMSEEFQTKIFEAFSQENNGSRTTYKGTGLGMAISKQFVDLMGGTIQINSQLNNGSCFIVELEFDINYEEREEKKAVVMDNISGMRILLVEDNELNMEIAQEILTDEGAIVSTAENGQMAYNTFITSPVSSFDAILMDIMMPVMNGYDATKAIRSSSHAQAKTIPIIAMTANAYAEDVQTALEAGMNAHIAKPINISMLLSVLNSFKTDSI
jgi:signal transduction histidine kinase